ncbi:MAG: hypothetical protein AB4352_19815 [Hormoscilla sp.]
MKVGGAQYFIGRSLLLYSANKHTTVMAICSDNEVCCCTPDRPTLGEKSQYSFSTLVRDKIIGDGQQKYAKRGM